jgi:hypothetical protein
MVIPQYTSLDSIMTSSNRTHFTQSDGQHMISTLKQFAQSGRRLNLHPIMVGSVQEAFNDGLIVLRAEDLETDFAFVKVSAGRGLFGGQKSRVMAYVGSIEHDELMPSTLFKNLVTALASVHGIYRSQGR